MEVPHPKKGKMLTIDRFDCTTNPSNHLDVYKGLMYVQDVDDIAFCRYFPATFKRTT